ncbi:MAG: efflux RND transporter periplasmic adaptor subunit [Aquificota bacterium]|nr:efflux RND transporter periplasmic adaptor subunit [Aquificota bacterium]
MKTLIRYVVFLLMPVSLIIAWLSGAFYSKVSTGEVLPERREVKGLEVGRVEVLERTYISFTGRIVADERAEISTRRSGYVVFVGADEGDLVKKGQLLLRIDPVEVRAEVEKAKSRLEQAKKVYDSALAKYRVAERTYIRFRRLLEEGAVTQQEFDEIEARFLEAKANLESAELQVEIARRDLMSAKSRVKYTEIRAPFDGYVVERNVDPGDTAFPGKVLMVVEGRVYRVRVDLPERLMGSVRTGDLIKVRVDSLGKTLTAKVVEVRPSVDPGTGTFRVEALMEGEGLKSGMFARVFLPQSTKTIVVPQTAIFRRWDVTGVWVVGDDGVIRLRFVRTGRVINGKVEILSGLKEGERIVIRGVERACDGCRVGG